MGGCRKPKAAREAATVAKPFASRVEGVRERLKHAEGKLAEAETKVTDAASALTQTHTDTHARAVEKVF